MSSDPIKLVKDFWSSEVCGTHFVPEFEDPRDFYEQYTQFRYTTEWHIPELVDFKKYTGKKVLEIGSGNGADGTMFAKHGAIYTGVDITEAAVLATSKHFETLNLTGSFYVKNAEMLSFPDDEFDLVYSYGVLHHTPTPQHALKEVYRVTKPGGEAIIMMYNKSSINYHIRIMLYMRARLLIEIIVRKIRRITFFKSIHRQSGSETQFSNKKDLWSSHYENFLRYGWSYFKAQTFAHHCTDGPNCEYAYTYTKPELRQHLAAFSKVKFKVAHFPLRKYRMGHLVPLRFERFLASKVGFYLIAFASK